MTVRARAVDAEIWGHALSAARFVPLQQSPCYGAALARRGRHVRRILVEKDGRFALALQAVTRRVFGLPILTTALRGPFPFDDTTPLEGQSLRAALSSLQAAWPQLLLVSPDFEDDAVSRRAIREASCREIMTSAAIARVTLEGSAADLRRRLDQKWRNRLVRAEDARLSIDITRGGGALDWMLGAHRRLMTHKHFKGLPAQFVLDLLGTSARRDIFVVIANLGRTPVAGAIFLRHGPSATYLVAATEAEGRPVQAGVLVMWRGLVALQEAGARDVDLGLLDTGRSAGLARFKLGTGATLVRLCGTCTPSWF